MIIVISEGDLVEAMQASESDSPWLLDLDTGAVTPNFDELDGIDHDEQPRMSEMNTIEVPPIGSREGYRIMARFAAAQEDDVRRWLEQALDGKGAFRRFKDAVARWPDVRAQWFEFEHREVLIHAESWLADEGIDYLLTRPLPAKPEPPPEPKKKKPPKIGLDDLLLLGAPEGKTLLLSGKVRRVFLAKDQHAARAVFAEVARDIHEQGGLGWRKSYIEGKSRVKVGRFELSVDERNVTLDVDVEHGLWRRFQGD